MSDGKLRLAPRPQRRPWLVTDRRSLVTRFGLDVIFISDLRLEILIGVYNWERKVPQTVQFDLEIGIPDTGRPRGDRIGETIDYSKVVARIAASLEANHFLLIERLAEHVAHILMGEFNSPWVKVSVTKLAAIRGVKRVGVTIERGTRK